MSSLSSSSSSSGSLIERSASTESTSTDVSIPSIDFNISRTNRVNTITIKPKVKRSKNGCSNCKKLKIKCDEVKPSCEYCLHTGKICVYLTVQQQRVPQRPRNKTKNLQKNVRNIRSDDRIDLLELLSTHKVDLTNNRVRCLNSVLLHLNVSRFELRLLKYFLDFGGNFFSFGRNAEVHSFWEHDVPRIWAESELIRTAIYALCSIQLWTQYRLIDITNVYIDDDQTLVIYEDYNKKKGVTLHQRTDEYFQRTLTLLRNLSMNESMMLDPDISGQIIAANIIVFAFVAVHPVSPVSVIAFRDGSNRFIVDILEICQNFNLTIYSRYRAIMNTKYIAMTFPGEGSIFPPHDEDSCFAFVLHLKHYINTQFTHQDPRHKIYHACVDAIDAGCYRGILLGYVMPIFRTILNMAMDPEFVSLVRNKDYVAMKLMFYYSCICSIAGFKLFKDRSIWDSFVLEFKDLAYTLFNGRFEDDIDTLMYETVLVFKRGLVRFELEMLKTVGIVDYRSCQELTYSSSNSSESTPGRILTPGTPASPDVVIGYPPLPKERSYMSNLSE